MLKNTPVKLQTNQRLYLVAFLALLSFLFTHFFMGKPDAQTAFFMFLLFWCMAIFYDVVKVYEFVYKSTAGKGALLLIFSLCANLAVVLSNQLVNQIVGVDPNPFIYTITLLVILSIPIFLTIGLGIVYFVLLILFPFLALYLTSTADQLREKFLSELTQNQTIPYRKFTRLIQYVSFVGFCSLVFYQSQAITKSYESFLSSTTRGFIYHMEMYDKSICQVREGTRVKRLTDGLILVATRDEEEIHFTVENCISVHNN